MADENVHKCDQTRCRSSSTCVKPDKLDKRLLLKKVLCFGSHAQDCLVLFC